MTEKEAGCDRSDILVGNVFFFFFDGGTVITLKFSLFLYFLCWFGLFFWSCSFVCLDCWEFLLFSTRTSSYCFHTTHHQCWRAKTRRLEHSSTANRAFWPVWKWTVCAHGAGNNMRSNLQRNFSIKEWPRGNKGRLREDLKSIVRDGWGSDTTSFHPAVITLAVKVLMWW